MAIAWFDVNGRRRQWKFFSHQAFEFMRDAVRCFHGHLGINFNMKFYKAKIPRLTCFQLVITA
jgi:hypothetical protein